jgi:hypothetical protein
VGKVVVGGIVHACPCGDRSVIVPWTELVDDDFSLVNDCLQEGNGWEGGSNSVAHGNDAVLGVANGTLRRVLPMHAWCDIFDFDLSFCEETLKFSRGLIV